MPSHSTKTAGRSSKTARRTAKKSAKTSRAAGKKVAKSARGSARTVTRTVSTVRAPSIAPKSVTKSSRKAPAAMIRTISPPVQPTSEIKVMAHKYHVGEVVYYTSPSFGRAAASGSYTVVKLLPSEGDDFQYRIKSSGEAFERVAKESQLDRA